MPTVFAGILSLDAPSRILEITFAHPHRAFTTGATRRRLENEPNTGPDHRNPRVFLRCQVWGISSHSPQRRPTPICDSTVTLVAYRDPYGGLTVDRPAHWIREILINNIGPSHTSEASHSQAYPTNLLPKTRIAANIELQT